MSVKWKNILNEITPYKPGKPIEEVKRELGLKNVIKLASNENPKGPSPKAIKAIAREVNTLNRYPDGGCFYLRRALSEKLSVGEDNIVFGNGSDEVILLTLRAFINPGDEVIISDPTFLIYRIASQISDANVKTVPAKDYKYDLNAMADAVGDKTKIIFIANPDNPTGTYATDSELKSFIEKLPEGVLVVIDEAYYEFATGGDYPETLELIKREDRNVIVTRTFSKAYCLAGLRIGYGLARKDIAEVLNKAREPFNVNSLAQVAAVSALGDSRYLEESVAFTLKEKERFYKTFDSAGVDYLRSRTNFILIDTKRNSTEVFNYLLERGVIVRDMVAWGLKGHIRVNIGLKKENDIFFKVFKEVLEAIGKE